MTLTDEDVIQINEAMKHPGLASTLERLRAAAVGMYGDRSEISAGSLLLVLIGTPIVRVDTEIGLYGSPVVVPLPLLFAPNGARLTFEEWFLIESARVEMRLASISERIGTEH
jgi:hypothetical protein